MSRISRIDQSRDQCEPERRETKCTNPSMAFVRLVREIFMQSSVELLTQRSSFIPAETLSSQRRDRGARVSHLRWGSSLDFVWFEM